MSNKSKLNRLLEEYILMAQDYFIQYNESQHNKVYPLKSKKDRIIEAVDKLEALTVFNELVSITWDEYIETFFEGREVNDYGFPLIDIYIHWRYLVKNFFRRSGIYIDMFNADFIDIDNLYQLYHDAFKIREAKVRYLMPLELTDFSLDEHIEFKTFSIRKFSEDELGKILNNNINNIFYPWAVWDVKKLSMLWFVDITVSRKITSNILGSRVFYDFGGDSFSSCEADDFIIKNKPLHESMPEHVLKILVLFDWNYHRQKSIAQGFRLPFVVVIDDYSLIYPERSLSNYILPGTFTIDMKETDNSEYVISNYGFKPLCVFELNDIEIDSLKRFVCGVEDNINDEIFKVWPFMDIAFQFLNKAFFVNDFYNATEQLLWHMTTIEALLGEKPKGKKLTEIVSTRLEKILGTFYHGQKKVYNLFNKLYGIRCELVHGRTWKESTRIRYLYEARDLARMAVLWFILFLNGIMQNHGKNIEQLNREYVLSLIDLDKWHDYFPKDVNWLFAREGLRKLL